MSDLKAGQLVKSVTVAEWGAHNRPLDRIVYQKDGKDYLLMANNARGVMKVSLEGVPRGQADDDLDVFDKDHALVLFRDKANGPATLDTIELP